MNQNQRYNAYKGFTGYECLMAFNQRYNAREGITGGEYAAKPRL